MKAIEALEIIIKSSGESRRDLSENIGKSPNYIASVVEQSKRKDGGANSATIAAIAEACGYKLALIPEGKVPKNAIMIDPPKNDGEE